MKSLLFLLCLTLITPLANGNEVNPESTDEKSKEWAASLPVGSTFPPIHASDQAGKTWTNDDLAGNGGFLFMFSRSVVW